MSATRIVYTLTVVTDYPEDMPEEMGGVIEFLTMGSARDAWVTKNFEREETDYA